jgi:hypothetical protein
MTQPRRAHDAYAGFQTINSATNAPIVFVVALNKPERETTLARSALLIHIP